MAEVRKQKGRRIEMIRQYTKLIVAALALCAGSSQGMAQTCTVNSTTETVTCTLSTSASSIDLTTVLTNAQALNPDLNSGSPIIITAFGGAGADGNDNDAEPGGDGGAGGSAQLVTTLGGFSSAYGGTTTIYYYLGSEGDNNHPGGKGGSATIVSTANLASTAAATSNVLLIAGGGGGGASAEPVHSGHSGGNGGNAVSQISSTATQAGSAATAAGAGGGSGSGSGGGGAGGNNGTGGSGGSAGSGSDAQAGTAGNSGLGGQGGAVHVSSGATSTTTWLNVSGVPSGIGTNGQGGEGEVRCSGCGEGGGGGGGYGGGGGGGGGGDTYAGGGGGGGGSYAAASTAYSTLTASNTGNNGSVVIIIQEICAGSVGEGETLAQNLLTSFVKPFNAAWPTIAVATDLDPLNNVYDGTVNLGCGLGGIGDAICGVEGGSKCLQFYADVDVSQIDGLSGLQIESITLETTNQQLGNSCPYDSSAVTGASFGCSLYGSSTADVELSQAKVVLSSLSLKVQCDWAGAKSTQTLWAGNATCTATGGTATSEVDYCAGLCSFSSGASSLVALQASDLKLKLTGINCDINTTNIISSAASLLDPILDEIADALGTTIETALTPTIQSALNDVVDEVLPLPSSCSTQAASQ
jgi:hypothetical protein